MDLREHPKPYKFFPEFERFEPLILDHTAMINAKTCLRKYFFAIVLGANPRGKGPMYFSFGSAYHKFREVLEIEWQKEKSNDEKFQKDCFGKAFIAGTTYYDKATGGKDPSLDDKFGFLTRQRLIQSFAVAFKKWQDEKKNNRIQVLAVEQPFNVELAPGSGEYTSGRFDQIIRWDGKIYGRDWKTSSKEGMYYSRGISPNDQFTRYTFAEQELAKQRVQGQVIEVLYNSKKKGPEIAQYLSNRTQYELDDFVRDEMFHRETLRRAREADVWPKQEHNCPFCIFHSVCKMGTESAQKNTLKSNFSFKAWNNMTVHLLDGEK